MAVIFTGGEIVGLGIQIERNGKDFYETLSAQSKSGAAKKLFKYLAGEEEKHIATFEKILNTTEKYEPTESYRGEYSSYLKALASECVFTKNDKGKEAARNLKTDKEAVGAGIVFEKDSIIFYEGMKKVVPEYDHKTINALIAQEQDHLVQLIELKAKL
ncbi:MAG: ferritin family protein [Candidatus Omnitrophica bacterium]|jgi:rubrerythrin|nr:ferritin family protein [Candidatus Omnitrophota bacterium]